MIKYKLENVEVPNDSTHSEKFLEKLNMLGFDGWELCNIGKYISKEKDGFYPCIFKKNDNSNNNVPQR